MTSVQRRIIVRRERNKRIHSQETLHSHTKQMRSLFWSDITPMCACSKIILSPRFNVVRSATWSVGNGHPPAETLIGAQDNGCIVNQYLNGITVVNVSVSRVSRKITSTVPQHIYCQVVTLVINKTSHQFTVGICHAALRPIQWDSITDYNKLYIIYFKASRRSRPV